MKKDYAWFALVVALIAAGAAFFVLLKNSNVEVEYEPSVTRLRIGAEVYSE